MSKTVHARPGSIRFHLVGAYQRNRARRYGLLDEPEIPDQENVDLMQAANQSISKWMDGLSGPP